VDGIKGRWLNESAGGYPCDVYVPATSNPHGYVIIYLHGIHLESLRDKSAFLTQLDHHGLPLVAPKTGRSWWTDRICPEFDPDVSAERHMVECVLPYVEERFSTAPPAVALLGTSMGGQGALRLAYKFPDKFPVVAAISPAVDFQIRWQEGDEILRQMYADAEAARQDTALLHIHPLNWPRHQFFCCDPEDERWFDSAERLRMKLGSLGIPHECELETRAGGHGFAYYGRMAEQAIGFIAKRLDQERMRIV